MKGPSFGKEKVKLSLAKLKREGTLFEIDVDPENAILFREGKLDSIHEVLKVEAIFSDAGKGLHAAQDRLKAVFGTTDPLVIAAVILKEGEIQSTKEHREKEREERRKRIIGMIHANAVNPTNDLPLPPGLIESAMVEGKIKIDDSKSPEEQLVAIVKQLKSILPIKLELKEIEIRLKREFAHKVYGNLKKQGKIITDRWENDGSWYGVIEIPGGLYDDLSDFLKKQTHGHAEFQVIKVRS